MLAVRSSRCAAQNITRNSVVRQAQAGLATLGNAFTEATSQAEFAGPMFTTSRRRVFFIRPWGGVPSMAQGLVVLRAFELEYGKLRDVRFSHDSEVTELYKSTIWASFEDDSNFEHIPSQVLDIKLEIPVINGRSPGDTSLVEVQNLLKSFDKAPHPSQQRWAGVLDSLKDDDGKVPEMQTVDLRIGRSTVPTLDFTNFLSGQRLYLHGRKRQVIGTAIARWGGFYSPVPTSGAFSHRPSSEHSDYQHDTTVYTPMSGLPQMRVLREKYASALPAAPSLSEPEEEEDVEDKEIVSQLEAELAEEEAVLTPEERDSEEEAISAAESQEVLEDTAEPEVIEVTKPAPGPSARQLKREKLLALARGKSSKVETRNRLAALAHERAHAPLPDEVIPRDPEEKRRAKAEDREKKKTAEQDAKSTFMGRLQNLWGW
ncbi:hypothetical protein NM688_g5096 [Phlebia brevispora]|uniref:Uncharacterized protein n=1 Tax=Phlebia brevispora TaxID=194682 RepID=A0ACC1T1G9_9APHY|nr:hypothetical protein NM688_g5096 [Phlebia brevispora]